MSNYYSITIKENLQYIYLTMFIMIYIVVILFYLKESNIPDNLLNDSKLLCKLKNIAEEENKKADKAHSKRLLTSLDNVNFTNDEN